MPRKGVGGTSCHELVHCAINLRNTMLVINGFGIQRIMGCMIRVSDLASRA